MQYIYLSQHVWVVYVCRTPSEQKFYMCSFIRISFFLELTLYVIAPRRHPSDPTLLANIQTSHPILRAGLSHLPEETPSVACILISFFQSLLKAHGHR